MPGTAGFYCRILLTTHWVGRETTASHHEVGQNDRATSKRQQAVQMIRTATINLRSSAPRAFRSCLNLIMRSISS